MGGMFPVATIHRVFGIGYGGRRTAGRASFLFFKNFQLVLTKFSFWWADWALVGDHYVKFKHFHDFFLIS